MYVLRFLKGETIQGGTLFKGGILIKEIRYLFLIKKEKKSDRSQECERDAAGA